MSHRTNVQVGDVGTLYKARIVDDDEDVDLDDIELAQFIFYTPSGTVTRTATVTTSGSGATQKWYMNYVHVFDDIAAGLHEEPGVYQLQAYVKFSNTEYYYSSIYRYVVGDNL